MEYRRICPRSRSVVALSVVLLLVAGATAGLHSPLVAQIPDEFQNLQFFPEDIEKDSLIGVMRGFSFALGVRCQYCHVGGDGISFEGVEFHKDDDPDKRKARFMLRMTDNLNGYVLPLVPERDQPNVRLECKTCHRGQARPVLLTQELEFVIDEHGVDSAAARYRELRQDYGMSGAFDFGEWEMNTLGERLNANGRFRDAIGIYELNAEYHPQSASITFSLGNLYVEVADTAAAIRYFERTLELQPRFRRAKDRLDQLRGN